MISLSVVPLSLRCGFSIHVHLMSFFKKNQKELSGRIKSHICFILHVSY